MTAGRILDVGCGPNRDPRATDGMDRWAAPGVTILHDAGIIPWPIADGEYAGAISHQFLEHLPQREDDGVNLLYRVFDEFWRVLQPGGTLEFDVPHARSWDANSDVTHHRLFTPWSFRELWDPGKNPLYPRRLWVMVRLRVDRHYIADPWVRRHLPALDRVMAHAPLLPPRYIHVVLRRP